MKLRVALLVLASICLSSILMGLKQGWPELTSIDNQNPHHALCMLEGTSTDGSIPAFDKAAEDRLKNRFQAPPANVTHLTLNDLDRLMIPNPTTGRVQAEGEFVSIDAWVANVDYGGGADGKNGEACNCQTVSKPFLDTHITLAAGPASYDSSGHGCYIAEVTARTRELAREGLLRAHDPLHGDWSTPSLKNIENHYVRIYGFLFFDNDHVGQAWDTHQNDPKHANWRQTCFEIHPVYGFDILQTPPAAMFVRGPGGLVRVRPQPVKRPIEDGD